MLINVFLLLLLQISLVFVCKSPPPPPPPYYPPYYYYYYPPPPPPPQLKGVMGQGHGGHTIPPGLQYKWLSYLDKYEKEIEWEKDQVGDHLMSRDERGPGSAWPPSWIGFSLGHSGANPPPWAYVPVNQGYPEFCYLEPEKGNCDERVERWSYNPYFQKCVDIWYTGCGGNQNNFKDKWKCEEACMTVPMSGCNPGAIQSIEEFDLR